MYFYTTKENRKNLLISNELVNDSNLVLLNANTSDAATEKHVPVVTIDGNKVSVIVGEVVHPMLEEHLISHIILETDKEVKIVKLSHTDEPKAEFILNNEKPIAVYEYCSLHSLWKKEINE